MDKLNTSEPANEVQARINFLMKYVNQLRSKPKMRFDSRNVPEEKGLYAIYDENDDLIYVGRTSNLKRRILGNHRSGNVRGSAFRRALMREKGFETERELSEYIRGNCAFQYLPLDEELLAVEHFVIAVLIPKLNS